MTGCIRVVCNPWFFCSKLPEDRGMFWNWCSGTVDLGIVGTYYLDGVGITLWILPWCSDFPLPYEFNEK